MLRAIDHVQIAIPVGGEARARPFYGDLLGLTEVPKPAEMAKRGGCWFEQGAVKVHLGVEQDFRPNVKAHVAFVVEDVADIAARAKSAGYETKANDEIDGVERVFIFDPFGNRLEFLKSLPLPSVDPADPNAFMAIADRQMALMQELLASVTAFAARATQIGGGPEARTTTAEMATSTVVSALFQSFEPDMREAVLSKLEQLAPQLRAFAIQIQKSVN